MSEKVNNSPQKHRGPMGRGPMGAVEKPKNFKGSTKKLLKYMGKYKGRVSLVIYLRYARQYLTLLVLKS